MAEKRHRERTTSTLDVGDDGKGQCTNTRQQKARTKSRTSHVVSAPRAHATHVEVGDENGGGGEGTRGTPERRRGGSLTSPDIAARREGQGSAEKRLERGISTRVLESAYPRSADDDTLPQRLGGGGRRGTAMGDAYGERREEGTR